MIDNAFPKPSVYESAQHKRGNIFRQKVYNKGISPVRVYVHSHGLTVDLPKVQTSTEGRQICGRKSKNKKSSMIKINIKTLTDETNRRALAYLYVVS